MLPKKIDKSKTYYKITNAEECHYGLQYKTGLNIDPVPFNNDPKASCCKGGIYFTTSEFIHKYFWRNYWIREVIIPENAQVVLDPSKDKYRADKIILGKKHNLEWYFDNIFDKKTFSEKDYWWLAKSCSDHFHKWFNKTLFPKDSYWFLTEYCSEYFDKWFDKNSFPKKNYYDLAVHCSKYFNAWYDKKTYPEGGYCNLAEYCSKYFYIWYDKKTFLEEDYWYLKEYCQKYKHIWE